MGKSSTSSKLKREILQGDELRQLRQKVISIIEVHSDWGYTDVARLILDGNNAPKMDIRCLAKFVERTAKNEGKDGRASNGRAPWVRTPRFIEDVRKAAENKVGKSSRNLAARKGCSQDRA